jgi:hypothetical protein
MSMFHTYSISCPDGHSFKVKLARGINAVRTPKLKQDILDGTFHRVSCPDCKKKFRVEKAFSYTDLAKNLFVQVKPRSHFFNWKEASERLVDKAKKIPAKLSDPKHRKVRIAYGLEELREKILCEELKISDTVLELAKVILLYDHPFLMNRPRLALSLKSATKSELVFTASHEHDKRQYSIHVPKRSIVDFGKNEKALKQWLKNNTDLNNILDPKKGNYVHFKRLLPQTNALSALRRFAKDASTGKTIDHGSAEFKRMLKSLPRGSHLSTTAKNDIKILKSYAKRKKLPKLSGELWEVYFGKDMEDDFWTNSDKNDIDTIWRLFEELPDNNIEGNNRIKEISLSGEPGGGGTFDSENGEIELGNKTGTEDFEDTIRHEVGHGVYYEYEKKIQKWLEAEFGWQVFDFDTKGLDTWMNLMGGWGKLGSKEKKQVYDCLKKAFEHPDDWERGDIGELKADHPMSNKKFAARKVYDCTPGDWFRAFKSWHTYKDKAFFLNYYYDRLYVVNKNTLGLIGKMPDNYAAMSHEEFFAELYALYYDKDDPKRKVIPPHVMQWMKSNLG